GRSAGEHQQRKRQRTEQRDVLARRCEQVRQTRALEVLARRFGDVAVLAEHHAARQGRSVSRKPCCDSGLCAPSDRIDKAGDTTTATDYLQRFDPQLAPDTATTKEGGVVQRVAR